MTTRLAGGLIAAAFAIGTLTGAAGIIVVRDVRAPASDFASVMAGHMSGQGMTAMMSGSMMGAGPGMMRGPAASSMPGSLHDLHHPSATADGAE